MRTRVSGLLSVVLLVLLMGGYVMVAHGAGRMGEEHLDSTASLLWPSTGPQFRVSVGTHPLGGLAMAFNPQTNRYLVVWADERSGHWEIWGTLVDASGNQVAIGGPLWSQPGGFLISTGDVGTFWGYAAAPIVACGDDEYLVLWSRQISEDPDIVVTYGRRVSADGCPIGDVLGGYCVIGPGGNGMVVYNNRDNEYLHVVESYTGFFHFSGVRISATGEILGYIDVPAYAEGLSYNPVRNEYLILYLEWELDYPDSHEMVYVQRLSNTGVMLGDPIHIAGTLEKNAYPRSISYNTSADEYLVSWRQYNGWWGRRMSGDGTYLSGEFLIQDGTGGGPLVYNSVGNEYLATWGGGSRRISSGGQLLESVIPYGGNATGYCPQEDRYLLCRREDSSICCRYLTGDGSTVGVERSLVGPPGHQSQLAISYHEALDQYLVVWRDTRSDEEGDIYAQRVGADGALWGGNFSLGDTYSPSFPAVAYNEQGLEWLVVWQERASGGQASWLRGQRVSASGDLLGACFDVDVAYYQVDAPPAIAYNGTENQYLAVWSHTDAGELHGRRVAVDGTVLGDAILLATGGSQNDPDVAYNSVRNEYLVVWEEDDRIYARQVLADGTMPASAYVAGDDANSHLPSLAYNAQEDQYLLAWSNWSGEPCVVMQRLYGNGTLQGGPRQIWDGECPSLDADVAYNPATNTYTLFCWLLPGMLDFYFLEVYQVDVAGDWVPLGYVGQGEFTGVIDSCEPRVACSSSEGRCMLAWRGRADISVWGSECGLSAISPTPTVTSSPTETPTATPTNTPRARLFLPLVCKGGS